MASPASVQIKNSDYSDAARMIGDSKLNIYFRDILPNSFTPVMGAGPRWTWGNVVLIAGAGPLSVHSDLAEAGIAEWGGAWWSGKGPGGASPSGALVGRRPFSGA